MKHTDKLISLALALMLTNCSFLQKENVSLKDKKQSREIASYRTGSDEPVQPTQKQKQAMKNLIRGVKSGKLVFSKAVVIKNNQPVCGIDLKKHPRMAPPFARAAPANHKSAFALKRNAACPKREKDKLAYVSQRFIPGGEQVAIAPIIGASAVAMGAVLSGGGAGIFACLWANIRDDLNLRWGSASHPGSNLIGLLTAAIGGSGILIASQGALDIGATSAVAAAGGTIAVGAAIMAGIAGYAICSLSKDEKVIYTVE